MMAVLRFRASYVTGPEICEFMRANVSNDRRYPREAYEFVLACLQYTQAKHGRSEETEVERRHVTASELLEGMREYALQQFGRMALAVLTNWGIHATNDVGEIVFRMIEGGHMSKTESDSRRDFDEVYDFDEVFCRQFQIAPDSLEPGKIV